MYRMLSQVSTASGSEITLHVHELLQTKKHPRNDIFVNTKDSIGRTTHLVPR